ncbi:hypothetical protein BDM02DRAFT_3269018 [Thelephora ganbajun]|uniref:Uncharacterized protein n=1 Tax=Thelephora ganbajun TaxID=370292 RepID=A0ACB6ZHF8_THEGA|nr:hypothetical protein BDM02DRAFT_3269018 [Thelephora ganbajun]
MDDETSKLIKDLFAAVEEKNGGKLTPDQVTRVSLKLGEMLGDPDSHEVTQNEKGQLLNEEGLPIIEITEQVGPEQASTSNDLASPFSVDLPVWALSEEEKARRRAERERILDMLEEEERLEAEREAAEEEESRAAKKKRLEAARELQKAMGRALVQNVKEFKAQEEKAKNTLPEVDRAVSTEESKRLKPKKSVSFDMPPEESPVSAGPQQDWGDVTPARLQPEQPTISVVHGPMKFQVIERFPQKLQLGTSSKDSDDESNPEPVPDSDEDKPDSTPVKQVEFHSDESTEDGGDFEFDEGETDLDAAQDQREIALAYYEKREKFAAQAAAVFSSHSHIEQDPWDRPEVPLEASLTGDRPKPAISKFKADRIVSSSTSLDGFVVPASQSALMRDAVKLGEFEDDQLVGGPEDSDDDLKGIMELIKQGEVENVGPNFPNGSSSQTVERDVSSLPPSKVRAKTSRFKINRGGAPRRAEWIAEDSPSWDVEPLTPIALNVTERRGNLRLEPNQSARSPSPPSVLNTPLTTVKRSSPKLPSGDIPIVTESLPPTSASRKPAGSSQPTFTVRELTPVSGIVHERTPTSSKMQPPAVTDSPSFKPLPSMITDSPSFAPPKGHGAVLPSMIVDSPSFVPPRGVATMPPMIIDSPDFPPPKGATSIHPMIIESPDFPPPKGVSLIPTNTSMNVPAPLVIDSPSFPVGPKNPALPRVMSSRVVERSPADVSQQRADAPGKKVSRFAVERR